MASLPAGPLRYSCSGLSRAWSAGEILRQYWPERRLPRAASEVCSGCGPCTRFRHDGTARTGRWECGSARPCAPHDLFPVLEIHPLDRERTPQPGLLRRSVDLDLLVYMTWDWPLMPDATVLTELAPRRFGMLLRLAARKGSGLVFGGPQLGLPIRCAAAHSPCAGVTASTVGAASHPLTADLFPSLSPSRRVQPNASTSSRRRRSELRYLKQIVF